MIGIGRGVLWSGWVVWVVVERDPQPDLDVPAGDVDLFDDEAEQGLFLGELDSVDHLEDAGSEVADAVAQLVVAGELVALRGERVAALFEVAAALLDVGGASLQLG